VPELVAGMIWCNLPSHRSTSRGGKHDIDNAALSSTAFRGQESSSSLSPQLTMSRIANYTTSQHLSKIGKRFCQQQSLEVYEGSIDQFMYDKKYYNPSTYILYLHNTDSNNSLLASSD